jgi:hypothetical protein
MNNEPIKRPNIKAKLPVVQKLVYELRYHHGFTYLDRCGRILTLIERDDPQWIVEGGAVSPQGAPLVNLETGTQFQFSTGNLFLTWEQTRDEEELAADGLERFFDQATALTDLVVNELGIKTEYLSRIGFRVWYLFPAESVEEAEEWLRSLNVCPVTDKLEKAFDGPVKSSSLTIVLASKDRCYRLNFGSGERQAQFDVGSRTLSIQPKTLPRAKRNALSARTEREKARKLQRQTSPFVAVIDIDACQEDPLVLDVADFLRSSWERGYENLRRAIP